MRTLTFAKRNLTELSRDALGYIFCIVFPLVMLVIMSMVNESIPKDAGPTTFRIDNLAGGIIIFGQTFVMLFTAILVATDRTSSFLMRLFSSPMKSRDFMCGYLIPMVLIALVQGLLTGVASLVIAGITGFDLNPLGLLLAVFTSIPSALMFISFGLIAGTLFNEKSAPGICSVFISLGSFLGGIFFDAEGVGGAIYKVCKCMPFIYCTKVARSTIALDFNFDEFGKSLLIVTAVAVALMLAAVLTFKTKMRTDK